MIACLPTSWKAIFCALWRAAVAIATTFFTRAGWFTAQVSACMPPIDPPITAASVPTPK